VFYFNFVTSEIGAKLVEFTLEKHISSIILCKKMHNFCQYKVTGWWDGQPSDGSTFSGVISFTHELTFENVFEI
jgi:hypothetical protein